MKRNKKLEKTAGTRSSLRISEKSKGIKRAAVTEFIKNKNLTKMSQTQDKKDSETSWDNNLSEIIKLLMSKNELVSAENFEKCIPNYNGENMPIEQWFVNFDLNAEAYGLNDKQKYVHARNKMTGVAQLFLESTTIWEYKKLKDELCAEFGKTWDSAKIHEMLRNRKKLDKEPFREYVLQMKKIAAQGNIEESATIKYVVDGSGLGANAKYLLYSSKNIKELYSNYEIVEKVDKQNDKKPNYDTTHNKKQNKNEYKKTRHCYNCGSADHLRNECKSNSKCFKCNQDGHISRNCPQSTKSVNIVNKSKRLTDFFINGTQVVGMIDTGADVTILKYSVYKKLSAAELEKCVTTLRGLGNLTTHPIGQFTGEVCIDGIQTSQKFIVVSDGAIENDALLGYDFIDKFYFTCNHNGFTFSKKQSKEEKAELKQMSIYNIIEHNSDIVVPPQHKDVIFAMIEEYRPKHDIECPIKMKIVPDGEITPFRQSPSRLPTVEAEAVKKQVAEWLNAGIVRKSNSFLASRLVVVKKKDGTPRVCVDFRKLNSMVLKDCFPVPVMEDIFTKLQAAKCFIVMDLENGFFHVPVEEKSRKYLAFVTKEGLFEFNVAPFGFCNSPAAFIRFVCQIFQDLINDDVMELYMDDIIIYASTAEQCVEKARRVLRQAEKYDLKIKWKKCKFLQPKINFLGHVIEDGKIWPGQDKTNAVKKFKEPTNIKAVQSFLGLTGFFRKFIPNYAGIARPLTNLLRKSVEFRIGPEEVNAIETLKGILTSEPVLRIYDRNAPTELHTDASKEGFGATLLQSFEGKLHPIFFWSKRTSIQESNRHSYILEAKAIFLAVKKFRHYLLGIRFTLFTDCLALKYSTKKQDVPKEVLPWLLYLEDFSFSINHLPGSRMRHVDCLSRYPQTVLLYTTEILLRLKKAQQKDEHIKAIGEILKDHPYDNFKLKGGLVYKNVDGNDVLVVPKLMEAETIREAHNMGHFGVQKTLHAIKQLYWIPHLEKKVCQIISNCVKCIIHNKKLGKKEGFLNCIHKGDVPLHTVHVDHLGPMDSTAKQYKHILAVVDGFTKFVWLYPTKSTGSEEAIKRLTEWINIFGNPIRLVSDRGAAFTANTFTAFMEAHRIEHVLTTTGVARGNGQIERVNRVILSIIAKISSEDTTKWYKFVPQVQTAINAHVHSTTNRSPFQLLFGVKMNCTTNDRILQILEKEIMTDFEDERRHIREVARTQIQQAQDTYKRNFDKKRKEEFSYKIGDLVAIKRTQFVAGKKLASDYLGPYEVTEVKPNGRYNVKKAMPGDGPNLTSTSCDNMKLWCYIDANDDTLSSGTDDDDQDGRV